MPSPEVRFRARASHGNVTLTFETTKPAKYKGFCARLGPWGKSRSLQGILGSTKKNWCNCPCFQDNKLLALNLNKMLKSTFF